MLSMLLGYISYIAFYFLTNVKKNKKTTAYFASEVIFFTYHISYYIICPTPPKKVMYSTSLCIDVSVAVQPHNFAHRLMLKRKALQAFNT